MTINAGWQEVLKMELKHSRPGDTFNLEKFIHILETPFSKVCEMLGLKNMEPGSFLEVENCVFLFDGKKDYVFSGAVVMGGPYGFFGIQVGSNWLDAAGKLESQGFKQARELERFTKPGENFSMSVYLYPDNCPDASLSTVKDYSICVRYGHTL